MKLFSARGERRAHIDFGKLTDLWFMWSLCNLECKHCYVASSPTNKTLEMLTLDEIRPFLKEGSELGMNDVYFTGGEPFANKHMIPMIEESQKLAHVTILTNGVGPIRKYYNDLQRLKDRLTLRISLDHFKKENHDFIRGEGAFDEAVETIRDVAQMGFVPIVTVTPVVFENTPVTTTEAARKFKDLFNGHQVDIKILPSSLKTGAEVTRTGIKGSVPFITEKQMEGSNPFDFQCHYSRCVQKINGRIRVYPCPIIYNDSEFELGSTLSESIKRVYLGHHGCTSFCFKYRGKCGNEQLTSTAQRGI